MDTLLEKKPHAARLESLDALRGFDMLFITGLSALIIHLCVAFGWGRDCWLATQMTHVAWHGFRHHDMIFPLFLFIAGVSFPFSYAARRARGATTAQLVRHTVCRGFALFALGWVCSGLFKLDFAHLRFWSVLGRIGLSWMFAGLLFMAFARRVRLVIAPAILLGYGLLMYFGHAPDYPQADRFSMEGSIICWIDRTLLAHPHIYKPLYDPEGLLGLFTGTVTAMLGMFAGEFVREGACTPARKALGLLGIGTVLAAAGWGISALGLCPINKALWSPTFVLFVGGLSYLSFGVFYWIIDVKGYRRWALFFRVVGMNAIAIYIAPRFISFGQARDFFFGGVARLLPDVWMAVFNDAAYIAVCWLFLFFLYRKNVFLKV